MKISQAIKALETILEHEGDFDLNVYNSLSKTTVPVEKITFDAGLKDVFIPIYD